MPVLKVKKNDEWIVVDGMLPTLYDADTLGGKPASYFATISDVSEQIEKAVEDSEYAMLAYVDDKFADIPEFDPTELQSAVDTNTNDIASNRDIIESIQNDYLTSTDREELQGNIEEVSAKIDGITEFDPTEIQNAIDANTAAIDGKVDKVDGMGLSTNDYSDEEKEKLETVEYDANFYEHPVHTSYNSGLYKITVDNEGHVSSAVLAEKEDIIVLGIPEQDTKYDTEISDLSDRIDEVEDSIKVTNEALNDVSLELEGYKEANNKVVSTNASDILSNKNAIEEIQDDYLTSTDKEQLQDDISKVSEKATDNAAAIAILNGNGEGSIEQSIDNAFNEFAANISNDDVVNTYKELIDYAAEHNSEFVTLVGNVDSINVHVGEVETNLSNYKTEVSERFTEVDTTVNNHATNMDNPHNVTREQLGLGDVDNTSDVNKPISLATQAALDDKADYEHMHDEATMYAAGFMSADDKVAIADLQEKVGDISVADQIDEALSNIQTEKEVYVQSYEPIDVPDDTVWVDLDSDPIFSGGSSTIPTVSTSDNGKFMVVVNGKWTAVKIPSAEGVSF